MKDFFGTIIKGITPLVDKIEKFLVDLSGKNENIGIVVALTVTAVIFVGFLLSLIAVCNNKITKLTKELKLTNSFLRNSEPIDEQNINTIYDRIKRLPESLQKAWGVFLEQQTGYPSDYLSKKVLLEDSLTISKKRAGKAIFKFISALAIFLGFGLLAIGTKDILAGVTADGTLANKITPFTISLLGGLFAPLLIYTILLSINKGFYNGQIKKLIKEFDAFQDLLDEKIVIFNVFENEFVAENIDEINAAIEEIIARKMDKKEVIEISTIPKLDDSLPTLEEPVVIPLYEEVVAEAVEDYPEITEEQRIEEESLLKGLINVVINAIEDKENTTAEDLEKLAEIILEAKETKFKQPKDQEVLETCLQIMADMYFNHLER